MSNETLFKPDGSFPVDNEREYPLMKCGCVAQAVIGGSDKPACTTHYDTNGLELDRMVKGNYGLEGRRARCFYRHQSPQNIRTPKETDSHWSLPFFKYQPDKPFDEFYCGCMGWD